MIGIKKWIVNKFPNVFPPNSYKYYKFLYGKTTYVYPAPNQLFNYYKFYAKKHQYYDFGIGRPNYIGDHYAAWVNEDGYISRLDGPAVLYQRNTQDHDWIVNGEKVTDTVQKFCSHNKMDINNLSETDKALLKIYLIGYVR